MGKGERLRDDPVEKDESAESISSELSEQERKEAEDVRLVAGRERVAGHWKVVGREGVPSWLRFNPHVLGHFRPCMPFMMAVRSWFRVHNETFNIWTHMAATFLLTSCYVIDIIDQSHSRTWPEGGLFAMGVGVVCSVANFGLSVAYHTFMPTCKTRKGYVRLLNSDVICVAVGLSGSMYVPLVYGYRCMPEELNAGLQMAFLATTLLAMGSCVFTTHVVTRGLCLLLFLLTRMGILSYIETAKKLQTGLIGAAWKQWFAFLLTFCGGIINAMRVPERFAPGRFDVLFNSHQIMHWITLVAGFYIYVADREEMLEYMATTCPAQ